MTVQLVHPDGRAGVMLDDDLTPGFRVYLDGVAEARTFPRAAEAVAWITGHGFDYAGRRKAAEGVRE